MSIILLTVLVLLVGAVTYMLLKRLVRPVRVVGACILIVFLAAFIVIVQNRETIVHDRGPVGYPTFQKISEEDHNFLDEILQKLKQDGQQQVEPALAPVQSISQARIVGSGNEMWENGEWSMTCQVKGGDPEQHKGYHASIAVREGGVWKKRMLLNNVTPAPAK